jgi:hypothetical protein
MSLSHCQRKDALAWHSLFKRRAWCPSIQSYGRRLQEGEQLPAVTAAEAFGEGLQEGPDRGFELSARQFESTSSRAFVALDADGVLLDFNLAYAHAWEKAFGRFPAERDPLASSGSGRVGGYARCHRGCAAPRPHDFGKRRD